MQKSSEYGFADSNGLLLDKGCSQISDFHKTLIATHTFSIKHNHQGAPQTTKNARHCVWHMLLLALDIS